MGLFFCSGSRKPKSEMPKPLFVIFLDVHGVLFQPKTKEEREYGPDKVASNLDIKSVENLEVLIATIAADHNAEVGIVLTSPLRTGRSLANLKSLFAAHPIHKFFFGKIKDDIDVNDIHNRGIHIVDWIQLQQATSGPNAICGYLVLDDQNLKMSEHHKTQFVLCDPTKLFDTERLEVSKVMASIQFECDESSYDSASPRTPIKKEKSRAKEQGRDRAERDFGELSAGTSDWDSEDSDDSDDIHVRRCCCPCF